MFISGFFRSNAAFSAFVGLVSAVIGFLIGAYMPLGILPGYVRALTCFFPGSYSASLFRCFFMRGALSALGGTSAEAYSSLASSTSCAAPLPSDFTTGKRYRFPTLRI